MDFFTPGQHEQVRRKWRQARHNHSYVFSFMTDELDVPNASTHLPSSGELANDTQQEPRERDTGALRVLQGLLLLNLPAPVAVLHAKLQAVRYARYRWPETFHARWIAYYLPSTKLKLLKRYENVFSSMSAQAFARKWMLSPLSIQRRYWHTLITSNFVHQDPRRLVSNMLTLWGFGSICTRLSGMNAMHMLNIAIGSSLASTAAILLPIKLGKLPPRPSGQWVAAGGSGMVCAFEAIAMWGAPKGPWDLSFFGLFDIKVEVLAISMLSMVIDHVIGAPKPGGLRHWDGWFRTNPMLGDAAKFAGIAFGTFYYRCVLERLGRQAGTDGSTLR